VLKHGPFKQPSLYRPLFNFYGHHLGTIVSW